MPLSVLSWSSNFAPPRCIFWSVQMNRYSDVFKLFANLEKHGHCQHGVSLPYLHTQELAWFSHSLSWELPPADLNCAARYKLAIKCSLGPEFGLLYPKLRCRFCNNSRICHREMCSTLGLIARNCAISGLRSFFPSCYFLPFFALFSFAS